MVKKNRIDISRSDLENHLKEQVKFLTSSCSAFDEGHSIEAKRIAHSLRILLHDTGKSNSLFAQLGLKSMFFLNTSEQYNPDNLWPHTGLLSFRFDNPSGRRPWIIPRGTPDKLPQKSKLKFFDWWTMIVISAKSEQKPVLFSREDLVLNVADTYGGSHVDPGLEEHYMKLSKWNAVGLWTRQNNIEEPIENPVSFCLRQIAHELLTTLQLNNSQFFETPYTGIVFSNMDSTEAKAPTNSELVCKAI